MIDYFVIFGVLPIGFLRDDFKGLYFVWFSIFLWILSLGMKPRMTYNSTILMLLSLWFFVSLFTHAWGISTKDVCWKYVNHYLMGEAFMYCLAAVILLKTIIEFTKNVKLLYVTLPIAAIPWILKQAHGGQISLILSLAVAVMVWAFMNKRRILAYLILSIMALAITVNFDWVVMKFSCRPYVWKDLLFIIKQHPFIGTGFNRYLSADNMIWVKLINGINYGYIFRHNDYLSIAAFLGLPILIPIGMFLKQLWQDFRRTYFFIPVLTMMLLCFVQMTMFKADRALFVIASLGLFYQEIKEGL